MQNLLLTAKGMLKLGRFFHMGSSAVTERGIIADFGMAREYSARPLTPGVVTIWYRAPELLLGTKYYTPSVDMWSAGVVLAELLLSEPCLTGETPIEQLSLIVKLLGSPSTTDLKALSNMGCPELISWRRESLATGRADNLGRRFLASTSTETVNFLQGMLKWDPRARWTPVEALAKCKGSIADEAERWWRESPRAIDKELLPTFPEVRNGIPVGGAAAGKTAPTNMGSASTVTTTSTHDQGYIFDFDGFNGRRRPAKRPRPI
jgi:cyclin-dependent kinase 10